MSIETRNKIAYWFFLVLGMAGVTFQMYEFFTGHIDFNYKEIGVTSFFTVLVFKPTLLLDLFESIKNVYLSLKSKKE